MPLSFKSSGSWPYSHYDLIEHYHNQYDKQIASGQYHPFLYPWGSYGALVVIIYLLVPHRNRPWLQKCRFLAFAWIAGFATYSIAYTRAKSMASALGLGLVSAWSVAWVGAILVCNDAQTDFMRIERMEGSFRGGKQVPTVDADSAVEKMADGTSQPDSADDTISNGHLGPRDRHGEFAWQPYPISPLIERLDWVLDIFANFRGAGWNWRTSALPPPPKWLQEQLRRNSRDIPSHSYRIHSGQVKTYDTQKELLRENGKTLVIGYLALDALKTVMMWDPYFWGLVKNPPPPRFASFFFESAVLIHIYRLTLSMLAIKYALQTIFSLAPLFFSGVLGTKRLGARAEPWIYPETWAPYSVVLDRGLAGWWSSWWHQTFRFAFEQPSRKLIQICGMDKKSPIAKLIQLVIAFGLSGIVHGSGSYTSAGETRPLRGPMAFFLLQAVGIFAEVLMTQALKSISPQQRILPVWSKKVFTFIYVHIWFYYTAHLLCDDFAQGGVWLFEPVPVSLFRAMGLGADRRDGWWCGGEVMRWHSGDGWWNSGLAF